MKNKFTTIVIFWIVLSSCVILKPDEPIVINQWSLYQKSVKDAMAPDSSKIIYNLVKIEKDNQDLIWKNINGDDYVLVVTWKQNIKYYQPFLDSGFYNTGSYPIWVTTVPELAVRINNEGNYDHNLRLIQLLGLPPNSEYSYFVEFWVKPDDLFRPCPDKEIWDQNCSLCFPDDTDSIHIKWMNDNRISRYYNCELKQNYPWSQLGYTYDWNPDNKSHIGLSEFVIGKNRNIIVKAIYTTEDYLKKTDFKN